MRSRVAALSATGSMRTGGVVNSVDSVLACSPSMLAPIEQACMSSSVMLNETYFKFRNHSSNYIVTKNYIETNLLQEQINDLFLCTEPEQGTQKAACSIPFSNL